MKNLRYLLLRSALAASPFLPLPSLDTASAQSITADGDVNPAYPGGTSTWTMGADLHIGQSTPGSLIVSDGATVSNNEGYLAYSSTGNGTVTVTGAGSTWTNSGEMHVGYGGMGSLTIEAGGNVSNTWTVLGYNGSAEGQLVISGDSSAMASSSGIYVGHYGDGMLLLSDGGTLNAGTVILAGQNGSASAIAIGSAATDPAARAGVLNAGSLSFGAGSGALIFNHTDPDYAFGAAMSGNGTIRHLAGTTRFTGSSSFSGTTTVSGGQLLLAAGASLGGTIDVQGASLLGGSGTVGSAGRTVTIGNGATLSPGFSTGTLTVAGDLVLDTGSTYAVDLSASTSDRTNVGGSATINGATMKVTALDAATSYQASQSYTVMSATNGITGDFASLVRTSSFLNLSTRLSGNDLILTVTVNQADIFSRVAETSNEHAVATALGKLTQSGSSLALYNSILPMNTGDARSTYNQLGGITHAGAPSMLTSGTQAMNGAVNSRMRGQSDSLGQTASGAASPLGYAPEETNPAEERFSTFTAASTGAFDHGRFGFWASGFGSGGTVDGHEGTLSSDIASGGVMIGVDGLVGAGALDAGLAGEWRLGAFGGYSRASTSTATETTRGDNYHFGLYAGRDFGAIAFRSGIGYTHSNIDSTRAVTMLGQTLNADYEAGSLNAFGELGYALKAGDVALEPFANLSHVHVRTNGFNETGGSAALAVSGRSTDTTFTTLGMRTASNVALGNHLARVRGMLGWQHAFGDTDPVSTARFASGDAFTVSGTPGDRNAIVIEAGLDLSLAPDTTLGFDYNGRFGRHAREHTGTARIRMAF